MKNKKQFWALFLIIGMTVQYGDAQVKIGNNPTTIHSSAAFELESTNKGLLPSRMTTAQRDAIANPELGLLIFNTTSACLEYFNGAGWYDKCNETLQSPTGGNTSSGGTAVVSAWTSHNGCNVGAGTNNNPAGIRQGGVNQTMVQSVSATGTVTITLRADVTTAGTYRIATNAVNGVSFVGFGTFALAGLNQTVTLTATGSPLMAGNFIWTTNLNPSINVYGSVITTTAPLGSAYNTLFNGIINGVSVDHTLSTYASGEVFSNNTTCTSNHISAQGCGGLTHVTGTSGRRYSLKDINGQCWMQQNLNDAPSVYSNYTTTSWTNTTQNDDQGYWGYRNTTNTSWGATEPVANHGILYQWCGAMNATISERSRGACPAGFHVPSDCEWMYLEHGQGMSISQQNGCCTRANSTTEGAPARKLLITGGDNTSGFSALLAGYRSTNGDYIANQGFWWASTPDQSNVLRSHRRSMLDYWVGIMAGTEEKRFAWSVRCLKD
jgi:uncharacterized protein (TIGR02145 family)